MSKYEELNRSIGKATIPNVDQFVEWVKEDGIKWAYSEKTLNHFVTNMGVNKYRLSEFTEKIAKALYKHPQDTWSGRGIEEFRELVEYSNTYSIPLNVSYCSGEYTIVHFLGNSRKYLVPTNKIEVILNKDYSNYSLGELKALRLGGNSSISDKNELSTDNLRRSEIESLREEQRKAIEAQKKYIEDIQYNRLEELAEQEAKINKLKNELYEQKNTMLAEANKIRFELEEKVEELNTKIFYLETEINAIEGYFGEGTTFVQLRKGEKCLPEEPVVMFQKVRFLDEELGRYFSMRDVSGTDEDLIQFEQALVYRDDLFDLFCPAKKSISMIRISKTGKGYTTGQMEYKNILETYDKFHGATLAILLRNGDNMWIAWLDEEKISFKDDVFFQSKTTETAVKGKTKYEQIDWTFTRKLQERFDDDKKQKRKVRREFASRYILFSVLQGILDNGSMLSIPEQVNVLQAINQRNPYLILSVADGWLEDTRFPTFSEMIDKYSRYGSSTDGSLLESEYKEKPEFYNDLRNAPHKQDDVVYVLQNLSGWSPSRGKYAMYNTDNRSNSVRGYDLAFSVDVSDGVYKLNLVKQGEYKLDQFTRRIVGYDPEKGTDITENTYSRESEYYIRGQKEYNRSDYWGTKAKRLTANFRLYPHEFINLTFLNSVFIDYVITTKRVGNYAESYAHLVPMLNSIRKYLKEREALEIACIREILPDFDMKEWQVALSDWKLEKGVRKITPFQAKRFLKHLQLL